MSRRGRSTPSARLAEIGRALVSLVTALSMLAPSMAWAGTPFNVLWFSTHDAASCGIPVLEHEGDAIFSVNETPLPTYGVAGALVERDDGSQSNTMNAAFDSVLLSMGANAFYFGVRATSGDDTCIHAHEVANLVSKPLGLDKPLFDLRRDGTAFYGVSGVDLSLAEVNPPLARDIEVLRAAIAKEREALLANASKVADLAEEMSRLQELDTELSDLVTRPLDEIAQTDLDEILDRYTDVVGPETRAALEQLVEDLKQSVVDLEDELARLIDEFGAQADSAADFATGAAREAGWNPDDPSGYALGESDVPWVEVPDISSVPGAFDADDNPYAAFADGVIAALEESVSGGQVINRAGFVANVRGWRANTVAIEEALRERAGVSLAETNAFLDAQGRVTAYVRRFMDASDWFRDTPVRAGLRGYVDGVLKRSFEDLADQMKDSLNLAPAGGFDLTQTQLFQTIEAFGGAMSAIGDGAQAYAGVMGTLVHATTRIGIGFVPFVGPALDLCEAVTGKSWCLPSGQQLSTEERIFSGVGFGIAGIGPMWRGVKNVGLGPAVAVTAEDIARMGEELATTLHGSRRTWFKTLRGAIASGEIELFEREAALHLMKNEGRALIGVGDGGVRKVLGMTRNAAGELPKAPDFLSVTRGNKLALSEAKGGKQIGDAVKQLEIGMNRLKDLGLAGDVERVEIIVKKGVKIDDKNFKIVNGYLIRISDDRPVDIDGFRNLFVRIIEI